MSETYNWNTEDETPLVKRLREEIEKRDKRMKELDETVNKLTGQVRTQSLSDILREVGAKPGLAKFVPLGLESTKEAVTAWLKENEELFGVAQKPADGQEVQREQAPSTPQAPQASAEQIAAFQRMGNSDNNTTAAPDLEQTQVAQLAAMRDAAGGNFDMFLAHLRGEKKL